jgi:hypothetical protein
MLADMGERLPAGHLGSSRDREPVFGQHKKMCGASGASAVDLKAAERRWELINATHNLFPLLAQPATEPRISPLSRSRATIIDDNAPLGGGVSGGKARASSTVGPAAS